MRARGGCEIPETVANIDAGGKVESQSDNRQCGLRVGVTLMNTNKRGSVNE